MPLRVLSLCARKGAIVHALRYARGAPGVLLMTIEAPAALLEHLVARLAELVDVRTLERLEAPPAEDQRP